MWSFETDPDFQKELDWIAAFMREKVEPLDTLLGSQWNIHDPLFGRLVRPLQAEVKARGLWACHLGPHLGGPGYGQLKLALMNEQLGRSRFGPITFGRWEAPDLPILTVTPWAGFPAAETLAAHYARFTARDLTHLDWYAVLACYRLGILLEGSFARACAGAAPMATGRLLHEAAVGLLTRAGRRIRRRREI